jgi:hypothetical protein
MEPAKVIPQSVAVDILPVERSTYESMAGDFVSQFSKQKGVLSIGQFGSINTPGVSDLDLLLVCRDEDCKTITFRAREFARQSAAHRYVFWHDVAVVPASVAKYLLYVHSLENLRTLFGPAEVLEAAIQPDSNCILIREILWNSYFWQIRLGQCMQQGASLRLLLLLSHSSGLAAASNYRITGNHGYAQILAARDQEHRRQILQAPRGEQGELAKDYFGEAVQILARSDWVLGSWMTRNGLSGGKAASERILLRKHHSAVFDDSAVADQGMLHLHSRGEHLTYFPSFYYTVGCLIARPYGRLHPGLANVWRAEKLQANAANQRLQSAAEAWNEVIASIFDGFVRVGGDPMDLTVAPFNWTDPRSSSARILGKIQRAILPRRDLRGTGRGSL